MRTGHRDVLTRMELVSSGNASAKPEISIKGTEGDTQR